MALTSVGYEITVTLRDSSNRRFTKVLKPDAAVVTSFALAVTAAGGHAGTLSAISKCVVESYRVTEVYEETAFALPGGGVNGFEQASIVANIEGELKTVTLYVPAPEDTLFLASTGPNRDILDISDAALLSYLSEFQTTGGEFTISDGEHLDDTTPVRQGQRINRKSYAL